ncbi:hypothetical protein BH10PLA1_BH10PLA1_07860 [soil metagenome]
MAKWWHYPAWRRVALQVTMWVLFGASLGVAGMVSAYRQGQVNSKYSPPIACGKFVVRAPVGWKVILHPDSLVKVEAIEPTKTSRRPRHLLFYEKQIVEPTTAMEFLGQVKSNGTGFVEEEDPGEASPVTIAGFEGVATIREYVRTVAIIARVHIVEYSAAAVSPQGQALGVKMLSDGASVEADELLFDELLGRITTTQN